MIADYHIHAVAHGEYYYTDEWLRCFIARAKQMGIDEIGFSEHDEYLERIDRDLIRVLGKEYPEIGLRLGLEMDFIPGRQNYIRGLLAHNQFDYVLGSVHFIDGWGFDHPDHRVRFEELDIDEVYDDYFSLVKEAVETGLFDIVSHLDLVKVWGHRPKRRDIFEFVQPVLRCVKEAGMVIEINSGGLRKPVGEMYPSFDILKQMAKMEIPITLGSDAHHPDQLGYGLNEAARLARQAGYDKFVKFESRRQITAWL